MNYPLVKTRDKKNTKKIKKSETKFNKLLMSTKKKKQHIRKIFQY